MTVYISEIHFLNLSSELGLCFPSIFIRNNCSNNTNDYLNDILYNTKPDCLAYHINKKKKTIMRTFCYKDQFKQFFSSICENIIEDDGSINEINLIYSQNGRVESIPYNHLFFTELKILTKNQIIYYLKSEDIMCYEYEFLGEYGKYIDINKIKFTEFQIFNAIIRIVPEEINALLKSVNVLKSNLYYIKGQSMSEKLISLLN